MHDAYRPTDDVLLNVSLDFPVIGSMHEFDQKGQTQGELWLRTHLAKIFNEILQKVNKWRCQAEHKNGLYGLFSVVINKMASRHKVDFARD